MRYFSDTNEALTKILKTIGISHADELFTSIPKSHRLQSKLDLPAPLDELSIKKELSCFLAPPKNTSFIGAGASKHFVPEWVNQQLLRSEWYTAYTPYQAEASQGILTALFEFQSIVSSLFGLDIANASMYDGATALCEALLMAVRINKKKQVIVSKAIHQEYRETVHTYLELSGVGVIECPFTEAGTTDHDYLQSILEKNNDIAAFALQQPNFFSNLEDMSAIKDILAKKDIIAVGCTSEPLAFALIESPGSLGIDIMAGEGLSFLGSHNLGGPGVGLLAVRNKYLRQMPGRVVGQTTDKFNNKGYVLTLATREQHIRRERATSNICTNHNLMALAFLMALSSYGQKGLKRLARINLKKTLYLRNLLKSNHLEILFNGPHFNETVVGFNNEQELSKAYDNALKYNITPGLTLKNSLLKKPALMINTTELHSIKDIKTLVSILTDNKYD